MIRVSIEMDGAAASSTRLSVMADSIQRALQVAGERNPDYALRVVFPLDPETFFVREPASGVGSEVAA